MSKFIVVTGGTKGIGRAILEKFASDGFDVCTCSRNKGDLAKLEDDLSKKYGIKAYSFPADMSVRAEVKAFGEFVRNLSRPIDVLVNNAGIFIPGMITEEAEGALESMINSNLYSAYHTTRALVGGMKDRKQGHIFNMCSIASISAYPNGGSYSISKFAMLGFSKVLREELKRTGIRVTAILPGATLTASWDGTSLPDNRFVKVEDVAEAVFGCWQLSGQSVVEEIVIRPQLGDI